MTVYFFYQPGCPSCSAMEPMMNKLDASGVVVLRRNVNINAELLGWTPKGTPGLAIVDRGELVRTSEGLLNARELEHFLDLAYVEPTRRRGTHKRAQKAVKKVETEEAEDAE